MKKIAFVFPGHGSQYVGMGESLCKEYSLAQETFNEANDICKIDFLKFCGEGSYKNLINNKMSLAALLTLNIAAFKVFVDEVNITPKILAGYSFGELTALVAARSINFGDALKIAMHKGDVMEGVAKKNKSAMTVIDGVDYHEIKIECEKLTKKNKYINIAVYNSKTNTVVSGDIFLVARLENILKEKNIKFNRLEISAPFHSKYFKEALVLSKKELKKYNIIKPAIPVVSSVTAGILKNRNDIIESLGNHFVKPVRWFATVDFLLKEKIETIIEIGPKRILSSEIKKDDKIKNIFSFSSPKDLKIIREEFSLNSKEIIDIISKSMGLAMSVKNSNNNNKEYNKLVIGPYREVKEKLEKLREGVLEPKIEDVVKAFKMLKSVLMGKKTKTEEAEEIMKLLYKENKKFDYICELNNI